MSACARCGARLRRTNPDDLCSPCGGGWVDVGEIVLPCIESGCDRTRVLSPTSRRGNGRGQRRRNGETYWRNHPRCASCAARRRWARHARLVALGARRQVPGPPPGPGRPAAPPRTPHPLLVEARRRVAQKGAA